MEPTPTPWMVEPDTVLIWGACNPEASGSYAFGYPVAECRVLLGHPSPLARNTRHDEAEANAAFIVKACNSHAQLVAALQCVNSLYGAGFANDVREVVRAALATAEAQP